MIGNVFMALARNFLADHEINSHFAARRVRKHVSKHRNQRNMKRGRCIIADNSSFKKRMRSADGFSEVKLSPARKREHWHAARRQMWNDISLLVDNLAKDRERRRLMRLDV